jgi:hypothetical protein
MPSGHSISTQAGRIAAVGLLLFSLVAIAAAIGVHPAGAQTTSQAIASAAASQAGTPYCDSGGGYGGPTLQTNGSACSAPGYSCMSLAMFAVYHVTGVEIPQADANDTYPNGYAGTWIKPQSTEEQDVDSLEPGDAVFFGGAMNNYAHTGIYAGSSEVWDAGTSTTVNPTGKVAMTEFSQLVTVYGLSDYQGAMDYNSLAQINPPPPSGSGSPPPPGPPNSASSNGYDLVGSDGGVFVFKGGFYGSLPGLGIHVNNITGIVTTAADNGYFLVGSDGGVFAFHAHFANSLPGLGVHVNNIVGIVPTVNDQGYFLVGSDGGVFSFNAPFEKSLPGIGIHVNDIVGIAATADDNGYWLIGSNGAVYAFGDAHYYGNAPQGAVGITATDDGLGYWVVGANGAVTPFGDAGNYGDLPSLGVGVNNVVGIVVSPDSRGYNLIGSDGGVFSFGDAANKGSLPGLGIHVDNVIGAVPT